MKVILTIENHEDAVAAQKMLGAYLGEEVSKSTTKKTTTKRSITKSEAKGPEAKGLEAKEPEVKELETKTEDIDLAELTTIAKAAVAKTDRATVKDVISAYGAKLSEVNASDYEALSEELKAL